MAEEGFKRKLTAILSADAVNYSRLMGEDEETTVRTLKAYREVFSTLILQYNGKLIDSPGDNLLVEFASVVDAVQCAVAVQKELEARNSELSENRQMHFRIGINLGDVIQEADCIYGDGVNIAARLEGLSEPGGICISRTAFDHIESKLPYGYEFLGDQTIKNITKPVGAYRVLMKPRISISGENKNIQVNRKKIIIGFSAAALVFMVAGLFIFWKLNSKQAPQLEKAIRVDGVSKTQPVKIDQGKPNKTDISLNSPKMLENEQKHKETKTLTKKAMDSIANITLKFENNKEVELRDWAFLYKFGESKKKPGPIWFFKYSYLESNDLFLKNVIEERKIPSQNLKLIKIFWHITTLTGATIHLIDGEIINIHGPLKPANSLISQEKYVFGKEGCPCIYVKGRQVLSGEDIRTFQVPLTDRNVQSDSHRVVEIRFKR
jgi:class 3 adenylate cyclase